MKKETINKIDIKEISNPNFVKELSYKELDILSSEIRKEIVSSVSNNGGHLSSNLGVVEATIALCRSFDFDFDKLLFDVGHQSYTYKILTGRSLERLRQIDGVAGFQKISESKYDCFEAGHSSTSISAANGMAMARDLNNEHYDIVAFIGDGSIPNGLSFEGLNVSAQNNHKIIIVLNDNDMSISKPVGGLAKFFRHFSTSAFYRKSKNATRRVFSTSKFGKKLLSGMATIKNWFKRHLIKMNLFDNLGYSVIGPIDGHNIKALEKAFKKAKKLDNSVVVHIKTIKGKGYDYAENDIKGDWHGVGKFDPATGEKKKTVCDLSWSKVFSDLVVNKMDEDGKAITIVPGTGFGSALNPIFEKYPSRAIDVGIAEEHAVVLSSGLSLSGYHPIISMYSTFLQRAYDEISHDLARMNVNATILIDRSGLVGNDGDTHQGLYDEAFLISIPNVVVCAPSSIEEAELLFKESFNNHGVFCIRYPKEAALKTSNSIVDLGFGKWKIELGGHHTAVISVGPATQELKKLIQESKKDVTLVNALYQKPLDMEMIDQLISYDTLVIYDTYATKNGFASYLSETLLEKGFKGKLIVKAVPDSFVAQASINEQKEQFGLLPSQIIELL